MGGDTLLVVDVVNAHGVVILQTIWEPKDQLRYGRRQTRTEPIRDQAQLARRLAELVPLILVSIHPAGGGAKGGRDRGDGRRPGPCAGRRRPLGRGMTTALAQGGGS